MEKDEEALEVPNLALVEAGAGEKSKKKKAKREKYVDPWRRSGMGDMDADDLTLVDGHLALKEKPKGADDSSSQIDTENKENESLSSYNQAVIVMTADRLGKALRYIYT